MDIRGIEIQIVLVVAEGCLDQPAFPVAPVDNFAGQIQIRFEDDDAGEIPFFGIVHRFNDTIAFLLRMLSEAGEFDVCFARVAEGIQLLVITDLLFACVDDILF